MKVTILDNVYIYENKESEVKNMLEAFVMYADEREMFVSYMVIDGQEIFDEFECYLLKNLNHIRDIKVIIQTEKESILEALFMMGENIRMITTEISEILTDFYQGSLHSSLHKLDAFFNSLQKMNYIMTTINGLDFKLQQWTSFISASNDLEDKLVLLESALIENDSVLFADIIQFEILEILEEVQKLVERTIKEEGFKIKDVN